MIASVDHVDAFALVPLPIDSATFWEPLVSNDVNMFSIDCTVNAQLEKAMSKAEEVRVPVVSN